MIDEAPQQFTIPGKLPSMNDIIDGSKTIVSSNSARKTRVYQYTRDKKFFTSKLASLIMLCRIKPVNRAHVSLEIHERTLKRDPDNVSSGAFKFILDALVAAGVLIDDSPLYVKRLSVEFYSNAPDDIIVVRLTEAGDGGF